MRTARRRSWLRRLVDLWVTRWTRADRAALSRLGGLRPAAVVTGASEGIGRALAERLADEVAALILVARRPGPLAEAAAAIAARAPEVEVVALPLDVTAPDAAATIAAFAERHGLYIDEIVNNAGVGLAGALAGAAAADIESLVAVNVAAVTRLTRAFLPDMLARGRGGIINVASLGGYAPGPFQAAYYASRAYVLSLTAAIAWEERGRGVRIAVLVPGPVRTRLHAKMGTGRALYRLLLPSATPESVARAALRGYDAGLHTIHPGPLTIVAAVFLSVVPKVLLVPFLGWLYWPGGRET